MARATGWITVTSETSRAQASRVMRMRGRFRAQGMRPACSGTACRTSRVLVIFGDHDDALAPTTAAWARLAT